MLNFIVHLNTLKLIQNCCGERENALAMNH